VQPSANSRLFSNRPLFFYASSLQHAAQDRVARSQGCKNTFMILIVLSLDSNLELPAFPVTIIRRLLFLLEAAFSLLQTEGSGFLPSPVEFERSVSSISSFSYPSPVGISFLFPGYLNPKFASGTSKRVSFSFLCRGGNERVSQQTNIPLLHVNALKDVSSSPPYFLFSL